MQPAVSSNQLLFLKGTVNETHEGYFLLDTGASYNAISRNMVRRLNISEALASLIPMQGGVAEMDAPLLTGQVRLRLPTNELARGPVVALDLSTASRYHNLEVSGLIGYPALSGSVLSVNYRDSLVADRFALTPHAVLREDHGTPSPGAVTVAQRSAIWFPSKRHNTKP